MDDVFQQIVTVQPLIDSIAADTFIPLDACKTNALRLKSQLDLMADNFFLAFRKASAEERPKLWTKPIGAQEIGELKEDIQAFEYVFAAELGNASLYLVEQIGGYRTKTLIEAADVVFPKSVRDALHSDAVKDIQAAGRSLAFELATAVGFHTCRAVETTLLQYFSELQIELPEYKNLGRYIEALQKCAKDKGIDPKVLATLDQFRDLHRNPIMHPDVHLNMEEAQILFALAQSAISGIALDIMKLKPQLPAPAPMSAAVASLLKNTGSL